MPYSTWVQRRLLYVGHINLLGQSACESNMHDRENEDIAYKLIDMSVCKSTMNRTWI